MQTSSENPSDHDELSGFEGWLARSLYRFDCPTPHSLGEYALDLLAPEERTSVAGHVTECELCQAELSTFREFLSLPTAMPESLVHRVRRVLATPFVSSRGLAYSGLRGSDDSARVYQAPGVTITVAPGAHSGSLIGLVVVAAIPAEQLEGRPVGLVPRIGERSEVQLDDFGNFEIQHLTPGLYALEINLPDDLVVVEDLRVD